MSQKLRDYQVLDVLCGGTFYKVRHKVTNDIFAWKANDCSVLNDAQIKKIVEDVKSISGVQCSNLVRYYDTILHAASRTLYLVVEHAPWRSLEAACGRGALDERSVWRLVLGLARALAAAARVPLRALRVRLSAARVFLDDAGEPHLDCFELSPAALSGAPPGPCGAPPAPPLQQLGLLLRDVCYERDRCLYSDDLRDIINFLTDEKNGDIKPDVLLYHPTVLANLESATPSDSRNESVISGDYIQLSDINKCDSQKAVELCSAIESPGVHSLVMESPIYSNVKPKKAITDGSEETNVSRDSLSPTIAALALELPGFVPRSRRALAQRPPVEGPQRVSEQTLSQQWMTRLIALRQREESLNKRERELISKEIVNSPATKLVQLNDSVEDLGESVNGITLPSVLGAVEARARVRGARVPRRRRASAGRARESAGRARAQRHSRYEDLDSSLSADAGDSSLVVTAARLTHDNMPRRNIFPELSTKKVHFTPANPFAESDDSVTLTYYELGGVDGEGYQLPRQMADVTKFRYLDLEKATSEKRAAMQQWHSSPNKQAKVGEKVFADITNADRALRRTPSKSSISSKGSTTSGASGDARACRASARLSLAPAPPPTTKSRRSLLPFNSFKTPFKFMSSTKS